MADSRKTVCQYCQASDLTWNWNFRLQEPMLTDKHGHYHNCTAHEHDVFPGWCKKCDAVNLLWIRKEGHMELTEDYGLPHTCEQDFSIYSIDNATCRHCKATNLLWLNTLDKYTLVDLHGDKHTCEQYTAFSADWAEAKRMNYALEKSWVNSHPDDSVCKKCNGKTYTSHLSKNKRLLKRYNTTEPIVVSKKCFKCKQIGTFTKEKKAFYLKNLRKKYWPYNGAYHKWKKHS